MISSILACEVASACSGVCWPTSAALHRGRHDIAHARPLRHPRAPVGIGVLLHRGHGGLDEVVAGRLEHADVFGRVPDRVAVDAVAAHRARKRVGRADLGLLGGRPLDEQPGRHLGFIGERGVDREAPVPDRGHALARGSLRPAREARLADDARARRVAQQIGDGMAIDVGADRALGERVAEVGPVPVLDAGRSVGVVEVDVPLERRQRLGRVPVQVAVRIEPFAAESAEDRRIDVHVLAGSGEAPQRRAPKPVLRVVDGGRVRDVLVEGLGALEAVLVVHVLTVELDRGLAVVWHAVELAVGGGGLAPAGDDVVRVEPGRVGQRGVAEDSRRADRSSRWRRRAHSTSDRWRRCARLPVLADRSRIAFWRSSRGWIFWYCTVMPVNASKSGVTAMRLSKYPAEMMAQLIVSPSAWRQSMLALLVRLEVLALSARPRRKQPWCGQSRAAHERAGLDDAPPGQTGR